MRALDTGPELIDSYVLLRTTLDGVQYDVYVDTAVLSEHAGVEFANRQQTLDYVSAASENLIEAADRKRSSVAPDTAIVIDDVREIPS